MFDPPEQAKYRSLFAPALSPKAVAPLGEGARALAIELIEGFYARGECEFVGEFAQHLPIGIFMRLVDVPASDRDQLLHWADQLVRPSSDEEHAQAFKNLFAYAGQKVAERAANPGNDLISQLTKAQIDGRTISVEQLTPMIFLLLVGGLDTVASAMGFAARFLAGSPAHRRELVEHPERIPNAVEELLRRFPVVNAGRVVVRDMDYKGVAMREGDQIILPTSLHGLDDRKFDDPLRGRLLPRRRRSTRPSAMARTAVPGSLLARTELKIFLEEWLKRIPEFRLKPGTTPGVRAGINATLIRCRWCGTVEAMSAVSRDESSSSGSATSVPTSTTRPRAIPSTASRPAPSGPMCRTTGVARTAVPPRWTSRRSMQVESGCERGLNSFAK